MVDEFTIRQGRVTPIEWEEYAKNVSRAATPLFKYRIAVNLMMLAKIHENPESYPALAKRWGAYNQSEISGSMQMFALQSTAIIFELTENLAAMCFAYAEAVEHGSKFFPLLLRDFGDSKAVPKYRQSGIDVERWSAKTLFQDVSKLDDVARKYLALLKAPRREVEEQQKSISQVIAFRSSYGRWYQKFKHTNSILAFGFVFDVPGLLSVVHSIPEHLSLEDGAVELKDHLSLSAIDRTGKYHKVRSDSFLTPYQFQQETLSTLDLIINVWKPIRATQHRMLFGEDLPERRESGTGD